MSRIRTTKEGDRTMVWKLNEDESAAIVADVELNPRTSQHEVRFRGQKKRFFTRSEAMTAAKKLVREA